MVNSSQNTQTSLHGYTVTLGQKLTSQCYFPHLLRRIVSDFILIQKYFGKIRQML